MTTPYLKLVQFLQQKGVSLEEYAHYLSSLASYEKLHFSLKERGLSLRDYYHYLEHFFSEPSQEPQTLFSENEKELNRIAFIGNCLLREEKITLDELNVLLQKLAKIHFHPFLQSLFKNKKLTIEEFTTWMQANESFSKKNEFLYHLVQDENHLVFKPSVEKNKTYGPYLILTELGRGGMGIVYKAYHPGLNRIVALKVLRVGEKASELLLSRFRREIEIMASLQHPGIVQIYDSGMEGEEIYLAMEYIQGKALSEIVDTLTLREKLILIQKMLQALEYAHQQGILHRDLKLQNIVVTFSGEPKIADFGLAKSLNSEAKSEAITKTGVLIGTIPYMAPEVARSDLDRLDERTDIYAVGICLYRLLTQRYPFEGRTLPETLHKIITKDPHPPSFFHRDIRKDLDFIILKALEKEPDKRYASAKLMAEDLERFLAGYSIQSAYGVLQQNWVRWKRKYRWVAIGIFVLLGFVFILSGGVYFSRIRVKMQERSRYDQEALAELKRETWEGGKRAIGPLLNALRWSNQALMLDVGNRESEAIKWSVGEELLKRAYEREFYQIASYVIEEMQEIQFVSDETKRELRTKLKREQERVKIYHLKQLRHYLKRLEQEPTKEEVGRDAVFEISKMTEPEIESILLEALRQGNQYLLQQILVEKKVEYYCWIVRIVGRTKIATSADILFQGIQLLSQQLIPLSEKERIFLKQKYMIEVTYALATVGAVSFSDSLMNIRKQMNTIGLYWTSTPRAFKKLLAHSENLVELPSNANQYYESGNKKIQQENYQGAIKDYTEAIHLDPTRYYLYNNRGLAKRMIKDFGGAIEDFTESIRLQPLAETYMNRGTAKELKKDFSGALDDLNEAIQRNPQLFEAYSARGELYRRKGDFEKAIFDYTYSIRLNPQSAVVYQNRAFAFYALRRFDEALADIEKSIRLDSKAETAHYCRGNIYFQMNQIDKSLDNFNHCITLNPKFVDAYYSRAGLKENKGDVDGALQDYTAAISLVPTNALIYYKRGFLNKKKKNLKDALEDFNKAIQWNPSHTLSYFHRAQIHKQLNQKESAEKDFFEFFVQTQNSKDSEILKLRKGVLESYPEFQNIK